MITHFEIRQEKNGEEALILYFDYREEYAKEWWNTIRNHNVMEKVIDYIKDHQIKWNGNKVILISGGIVLSTLLALTPIKFFKDSNVLLSNFVYVNQEINPKAPTLKQDMEENENIELAVTDELKDKKESTFNNSMSSNSTAESNELNSTNGNTINTNTDSNSKPSITGPSVTVYRNNGTIITLGLEEYLIGVVGAEMPASFHLEALKAQAVIARTYALRSIQLDKKLTDTQNTQVFKDQEQLRKEWGSSFDLYYQKVKSAVNQTSGKYLTYNGEYIEALYFSTSNGYTEDASYVWGNSVPYLKSVESKWDLESRFFHQVVYKDKAQVFSLFDVEPDTESTISILNRNFSGRVTEVQLGTQVISGVLFRNRLGLASSDFEIIEEGETLKITTRGWGHGVGMSQYGANGMAKEGYQYDQILKYYYQGVQLQG